MITGLDAARSLQLPLPGVPIGYVPALSASRYTPRAPATRFENLLGLTPVPTEPAVPLTTTVAERLEQRTAERAAQAEREGIALFKQDTVDMRHPETLRFERCTDCNENLVRAMQRLRMAASWIAKPRCRCCDGAPGLGAGASRCRRWTTCWRRCAGAERVHRRTGRVRCVLRRRAATGRSAFLEMQMRRYARLPS
jgi:hypothetical protein